MMKDGRAEVAGVMFARSDGPPSSITLSDGIQVQAYGLVSVYEARGHADTIHVRVGRRDGRVLYGGIEEVVGERDSCSRH
jgi:exonuclease VII large subunit